MRRGGLLDLLGQRRGMRLDHRQRIGGAVGALMAALAAIVALGISEVRT